MWHESSVSKTIHRLCKTLSVQIPLIKHLTHLRKSMTHSFLIYIFYIYIRHNCIYLYTYYILLYMLHTDCAISHRRKMGVFMKTVRFPGYHHNSFVASLGQTLYGSWCTYELPQSHCGDSHEDMLLSWLHIYIYDLYTYIYIYLHTYTCICIMHIYIYMIHIYIYFNIHTDR